MSEFTEEVEDPFITNPKIAKDPTIKENEMLYPRVTDSDTRLKLLYKRLEGNGDFLPVRHFDLDYGMTVSIYKVVASTEKFAIKVFRKPIHTTTANEDPIILEYENKTWSVYAAKKSLKKAYKKYNLYWHSDKKVLRKDDYNRILEIKEDLLTSLQQKVKDVESEIKSIHQQIEKEKKLLRCPSCDEIFSRRMILNGLPNKTWICSNCQTRISRTSEYSQTFKKFNTRSRKIANKFHTENFQSINQFI